MNKDEFKFKKKVEQEVEEEVDIKGDERVEGLRFRYHGSRYRHGHMELMELILFNTKRKGKRRR